VSLTVTDVSHLKCDVSPSNTVVSEERNIRNCGGNIKDKEGTEDL
jgi:hypothetical protein